MTTAVKLKRKSLVAAMFVSGACSALMPSIAQAQALEEVIVTSRKRVEMLQDIPTTVNAFSEDAIKKAGIGRPADFLSLTPNVTFASSESAGVNFMSIRGVSQVRNGESPVAVVVDGVLMTDPGQFDQELFDIQQIEVLKGPQGALYGRNAIGGAINITTVAPSNELEGRLILGAGNGDRTKVAGMANIPLSDKATVRVTGSKVEHDGFIENKFLNKEVDYYEDTAFRGLLQWEVSDNLVADFRYGKTETEGGSLNFVVNADWQVFDFVGDANDTSVDPTANRLGYNERDVETASAKFDWETKFATITSITAWIDQSEFYAASAYPYECLPVCAATRMNAPVSQNYVDVFGSPGFGDAGSFVPVQVVKVMTDVETVSQEIRFTSNGYGDYRWIAGAYWLDTKRERGLPTEQDLGQPYTDDLINANTLYAFADDNENTAYALFSQFEYDMSDELELAFALRYDKDEREQVDTSPLSATVGKKRKEEYSEVQPKFTARYDLEDEQSVFFVASKGFRSGGFNQNGVGAAAAAVGISGIEDDYRKEVSTNFEIGYKATFMDRRVNVDAAIFRTDLEDQHFFQFLGAINAQLLNNIDEVELSGLELSVQYLAAEDVTLNFAYGLTDSEIKDYVVDSTHEGNDAPYVAKDTVNAGIQYTPAISDNMEGLIRLDYERLGEQYWDTANSTKRDPVDLINLRIGLQAIESGWSVTLWAKNLTDEEYNAEFVSGGIASRATPRTYGIDFSIDF